MSTTTTGRLKKATKKLDSQKSRATTANAAALGLHDQTKGVERFTLSLHKFDTSRLSQLEDYLRGLGYRASNRSLLVKVALRGVRFTPELVDHLKAAEAGDGRRQKS